MMEERTTCAPTAEGAPPRGRRLATLLLPELCVPKAERGAAILADALALLVALLFSRTHLAFGMYPFAISYLAAARRRCVPILLGALLGGLRGGSLAVFAAAGVLTLLLRALLGRRGVVRGAHALFSEGIPQRVLAAALTGAALGGYELAVSGGVAHALRFAAIAISSPPLLTLALAPILDAPLTPADLLGRRAPSRHPYGVHRPAIAECSALAFMAILTFALRQVALFGLSLGCLLAVALTLFVGRRLTAARSAVTGLCLGLIFSLGDGIALALSGLIGGFLFPYGALYGALAGAATAIAAGAYLGGLSGFLGIAPEAAVATLLVFPLLSRISAATDPAEAELARRNMQEAVSAVARGGGDTPARLDRLGAAFSTLSEMFHRRSDEGRRPEVGEYLAECERVCARHCATCSNRVRCWEQGERIAERTVASLAGRLREAGRITGDDVPPDLRTACPQIDTILDGIRDECATMALRRYRGDRHEFLAQDYAMLARLLSDAAEADRREGLEDTAAAARWVEAAGGEADGLALSVVGTRCRRLAAGGDAQRLSRAAGALHTAAEAAVGCRLTSPVPIGTGSGTVLSMQTAHRLTTVTASSGVPREGSAATGDCTRFFSSPDGYFYALLSDGEGSGPQAATASATACEFLSAMLSAGVSRKAALRMLNDLVRTGSEECSATVDLLVLDLVTGGACFIKSGAAPSYIKRGGEILRVRAHTVPLGITRQIDAERVNVELHMGDVIALLSDGLVPEDEDPAWLLSLLSKEPAADLNALAERIIAEAISRTPPPTDDITVALVRIEEEPPAQ